MQFSKIRIVSCYNTRDTLVRQGPLVLCNAEGGPDSAIGGVSPQHHAASMVKTMISRRNHHEQPGDSYSRFQPRDYVLMI
jgi:hypothetical protein